MNLENGSIPDWIQLLFVLVGGVYALFLLFRTNKECRNRIVLDMLDRFFGDSDIKLILYSVDQGRDIEEIRHLGLLEKQADRTIKYIDYLGRLISDGTLKSTDIYIFRYEITRILGSDSVKRYVRWLREIGVSLDYLNKLDFLFG